MVKEKPNYSNSSNLKRFWNKTHYLCDKLIAEYQRLDDKEAIEMVEWVKNSDLEYNKELRRFNDLFRFTEALDTSRRQKRKIVRLTKKLYDHIFSVF